MADGAGEFVFRPITPPRPTRPTGLVKFLWKSWRDPLTVYSTRHFEEPFVYIGDESNAAMNVADPAGVRYVLLDNARNFEKGDFQRRLFGPLIADGVFMAEGEDWRRQRRIMAPLFTPARLSTLAGQMREVCEKRIGAWPVPKGGSAVMEVEPEMTAITFEVISETMFSNMLGGEAGEFEAAFNGFVDTMGRIDPMDLLGWPNWIPRVGKIAGVRYARFFDRRVHALVAKRREMLKQGDAPDDLMTALLRARDEDGGGRLSEHEVACNVLTFILAGHETTARALSWCLHLLSRTPHYQEKARAEADAFDSADEDWQKKMPWSRAIFDETMRLFPPAPITLRFPIEDDEILGKRVPAGSMIGISPYVIHRHRRLWDDPDAFRPERFLPGAREKIDRFAYIPFSQGPRICIGATFAIQEALIALAVILRAFEIQPAELAEPMPSHRITLRSKDGIRLRMVSRG